MPRKVTRVISRNLLGESREEEKRRLRNIVVKKILKGQNPNEVLSGSSLQGATKRELANRRRILKEGGHPKRRAPTIRERRAFL